MRNFNIRQSITNRSSNSLRLYLKDIGKYKLLTFQDELELADKIKNGDERALQKLINCNLRFVVSIAKQYQGHGMDLEDIISNGNIGLTEAAKRYDGSKGLRFITYAVWWIRQSIIEALSTYSSIIKTPINQTHLLYKIKNIINEFYNKNFYYPSINDLSEILDIDKDKILDILYMDTKFCSLDAPITNALSEDKETFLIETIKNDNSAEPDEEMIAHDKKKLLYSILNILPPREKYILMMSFGFKTYPMPNEVIAPFFGLTNERVRQLKDLAINKLKTFLCVDNINEELFST